MLGVHDSDLLDSVYMQRMPHTTLMEFFPPQTFAREQEMVAKSVGMNYIAWWNDRYYQPSFSSLWLTARSKDNSRATTSLLCLGQTRPKLRLSRSTFLQLSGPSVRHYNSEFAA
jgi:hypothetical protein